MRTVYVLWKVALFPFVAPLITLAEKMRKEERARFEAWCVELKKMAEQKINRRFLCGDRKKAWYDEKWTYLEYWKS